ALDRCHVGKDVRVVIFQIVEDRDAWPVVHELRTLVEERSVVFVGLDDKKKGVRFTFLSILLLLQGGRGKVNLTPFFLPPFFFPETRRYPEIPGYAADQEARRQSRRVQKMCQQAGGGGLAVGTGHGQHLATAQHFL